MAGSVVMLRPEYGRYFEHPFVDGHKRLFVELGALGKIDLLAEVVELEYVGAALRARKIDFGRVNFGKALT